jgi:hypothetical protein
MRPLAGRRVPSFARSCPRSAHDEDRQRSIANPIARVAPVATPACRPRENIVGRADRLRTELRPLMFGTGPLGPDQHHLVGGTNHQPVLLLPELPVAPHLVVEPREEAVESFRQEWVRKDGVCHGGVGELGSRASASVRRQIEYAPDRPDWVEGAVVAARKRQLAGPRGVDPVLVACEHVQDRELLALGRFPMIIAVVGVVPRGQQPQIAPCAFLGVGAKPSGACLRDHDEVDPLGEVNGRTVEPVDDRGA